MNFNLKFKYHYVTVTQYILRANIGKKRIVPYSLTNDLPKELQIADNY